jgi:hypothetical protein
MSAPELLAELGSVPLRDFYVKYRDDIENGYERMSDFKDISLLYKECAEKIIHHVSDITDDEGREWLSAARAFLKKYRDMVAGLSRIGRISTEDWASLKSGKWYIGFGDQWFEFNSKKKWLIFSYEIQTLLKDEYLGLTFHVIDDLLPMLLRKKDTIISSLETVSQRHSTCVAESSRLRSQIAEKDEIIRSITAERDALQARINTAARAVANYEARRAAERSSRPVTYNRAAGNANASNLTVIVTPPNANGNPQGGGARKTRRHRTRRAKTSKRKTT